MTLATPTELFRRIIQTRAGGAVQRCHTHRTIGSYSNAEHQWGCAALLYHLWPDDFPTLVPYILFHDVPEAWTGDIPAPIGRHFPGLKRPIKNLEICILVDLNLPSVEDGNLTPEDLSKLKACDWLELYFWCCEQQLMGNTFASTIKDALDEYISQSGLPAPADALFNDLKHHSPLPRIHGVIRDLATGKF